MRAYVGVTDWDWYEFLRARAATEVNFWRPSGGRRFAAIPQGSPFLFKTHYSHGNRIVGAGFLSGWASLPMSRAWEFFGPDNGCADLAQMRARIGRYCGGRDDGRADPEIGCIMLRNVCFFDPQDAPAAPQGWSANIVQGRSYDLLPPRAATFKMFSPPCSELTSREAMGTCPWWSRERSSGRHALRRIAWGRLR